MDGVARQLRFALRQLRKAPGFSITVIVTLALGIGATTAMFSLVNGILLRPLPYADPDRLVVVGDHLGSNSGMSVTAREIGIYAQASSAFSSLGGHFGTNYEISGGTIPEVVQAQRLTASVFPTLGVQPAMGRIFTQREDDGHEPVAVISHALWINRFHRDSQILGRTIELDRRHYSIIGVMPRGFEFPADASEANRTQIWVPLSLTAEELSEQAGGMWGYGLIGRLKDGVSVQAAAQDADRVAHVVMRGFPASMAAIRLRGDAQGLRENVVGETRPLLRALFAAVCVVLLIACVNVAVLMLVRATRRRRACAVRLALGAKPGAILRESVMEGLLLSLAGGLMGLGLTAATLRTVLHFLPDTMPRLGAVSVDLRVAAFAVVLAICTGALCSLAPVFAVLRVDLIESLNDGARTGTGGRGNAWLRTSLVVAEIAIALVLLTVSGELLRSYQKMLAVDPGFRPDHVLVSGFQLPLQKYSTLTSAGQFNQRALERLAQAPGVEAAGFTTFLPATGFYGMSAYTLADEPAANWKLRFAGFGTIEGDYFKALRIPLVEGRAFTERDRADAPLVIIVNQSMAKHCWPNQSALGKRMHAGNPRKGYPWATVVGVAADTKTGSRDEPDSDQWYAPAQQPAILNGISDTDKLAVPASGYLLIRTALPPGQMVKTMRGAIAGIDPMLALQHVEGMDEVVSTVEAPRRFNMDLISGFAAGALLLAISGIYAVVAFSVSLRGQEIAIRMALGAQRAEIARMILISGAKMTLWGCGLGVLGSLAASRLAASFLFEVSAKDPRIYAASIVCMVLLALLASALPARHAASADPIAALRPN